MHADQSSKSIEQPTELATPEINAKEAAQALSRGPVGALVIASIGVGLLVIGWLVFYFFLFMPRGAIG